MSGQILDFDSAWFGVRVGRHDGDPRTADEWARKNALDCLYALLRLNQRNDLHWAIENGFRLVDVRVEFTGRTAPHEMLRKARPEDMDALKGIAFSSYKKTRFHNDRHFDRDRVNAMYANWVLTTDGTVLVAEDHVGPVGFVVVGETNLELIAVNEKYRGHGHGLALARSSLALAHEQGKPHQRVVTQGGNHAAQRTFSAAGFEQSNTSLWLHKWYE